VILILFENPTNSAIAKVTMAVEKNYWVSGVVIQAIKPTWLRVVQ
jgi:hypothetical protein